TTTVSDDPPKFSASAASGSVPIHRCCRPLLDSVTCTPGTAAEPDPVCSLVCGTPGGCSETWSVGAFTSVRGGDDWVSVSETSSSLRSSSSTGSPPDWSSTYTANWAASSGYRIRPRSSSGASTALSTSDI